MKQQVKETLHYLRVARKAKDNTDGFLYLHRWQTGYQELIFDTKEAAQRFADKLNTIEYNNRLKQQS